MIYEWRSGSRYRVPAQAAGEIVEQLADRNGGVCPPSAVVDEARDPGSPLHPVIFRLEQDQAAEAWYRQEARQLVNDITVVVEGSTVRPAAFYSVQIMGADGPQVGYAPREMVVASADLHAQALQEALEYLNGFRRRFRHLQELAPVMSAIEDIETSV